ncbi:MAG: dienelactone hydrolase [Bacteroidetes bacterium]|nr:dienelactone hydrolase [Bacteroidota bacterium]
MRRLIRRVLHCCVLIPSLATAQSYDPLAHSLPVDTSYADFDVYDEARDRVTPVRVFVPADTLPAPVVLFSHGLGGARSGSSYLAHHWRSRGYVAVFVQHPGSDESVWKDTPKILRYFAMQRAASVRNFMLRVSDVRSVLDRLEAWNREEGHKLAHRMDLSRVGMSGHSFGAVTTQAVSGQRFPKADSSLTDNRIDAAIAFSPSAPRRGPSPEESFGHVSIPWMLMTGTKDVAVIGDADLESRLSVYPALPPGDKYELVLLNAEHSAFSDRPLPGDREPRNPNHHRVILALSTAFWDAYLRGESSAMEWLRGAGPARVLEGGDQWQWK